MAVVSSFPAGCDWLVQNISALPECAAPVVVCDGWPDQLGDRSVVIGITPEDPETGNEPQHAELGAQAEWELVSIPCIVWAYVGGSSMKAARDAAFVMFDAIHTLMRTNAGRTLGGAVHSGSAAVRNIRVRQTGGADEAGVGRQCEIRFSIEYKSRF